MKKSIERLYLAIIFVFMYSPIVTMIVSVQSKSRRSSATLAIPDQLKQAIFAYGDFRTAKREDVPP